MRARAGPGPRGLGQAEVLRFLALEGWAGPANSGPARGQSRSLRAETRDLSTVSQAYSE